VERVDEFVVARAQLDKKTIANLLTLLISMLNAAVELGWLRVAPRIRKPRVPMFSRDFQFLRSEEEIRRFLDAADVEGAAVYALYATAVYTGMREGELAALAWDDVSFERRLVVVQRSFDGPTKAEDVRYVPILDPLLPILRDWRLRCPGQLVFPNRDGRMHQPSARVFQEVLHRVLERGEFPRVKRGAKTKPYITFHGLRHSFASNWMMRGGDLYKLQKILGHKSIQMTERYSHLAPEAFASDYGRLGTRAPNRSAPVIELPAQSS
jgi:integrase